MERIASVWVPALREADERGAEDRGGAARGADPPTSTRRLATALLAGSPRVMIAGPGLCRLDAGGWRRRGGEEALVRRLRDAVVAGAPRETSPPASPDAGEGGSDAEAEGVRFGIGVADAAVAADAAARLSAAPHGTGFPGGRTSATGREDLPGRGGRGFRIVPAGSSRAFLALLPLALLPLPRDQRETFRALGVRTIGEIAARERSELEARFGSAGLRTHRLARGEDDRLFQPLRPEDPPEARLELEAPVEGLEPLLFVLRHLLGRIHEDLAGDGRCARALLLRILLEGGECREARIAPAHPTRDEDLLFDLCRTGLERSARVERPAGVEKPAARAVALELRVVERAPAAVRQGDLFAAASRDPVAGATALARLRARLGEQAVVRPAPREEHRPEARSAWRAPSLEAGPEGETTAAPEAKEAAVSVLRLLPRPVVVRVRCEGGRPVVLEDARGRHDLIAAEGPERLSGGWWDRPYRREYFRVLTFSGELLWLFRDRGRTGGSRWHLHGWWD